MMTTDVDLLLIVSVMGLRRHQSTVAVMPPRPNLLTEAMVRLRLRLLLRHTTTATTEDLMRGIRLLPEDEPGLLQGHVMTMSEINILRETIIQTIAYAHPRLRQLATQIMFELLLLSPLRRGTDEDQKAHLRVPQLRTIKAIQTVTLAVPLDRRTVAVVLVIIPLPAVEDNLWMLTMAIVDLKILACVSELGSGSLKEAIRY